MGILKGFIRTIREIFSKPKRSKRIPKGKKRKKIYIPYRVKVRANKKFNKYLNIFKRKYKRNPTKNELIKIIVSVSHVTERKPGGKRGHWRRQRIRKYLAEKNKIVDNFVMK